MHSTSDDQQLEDAHAIAVGMFGSLVTPIMRSTINGEDGFAVWTSGGKRGLDVSEKHGNAIAEFLDRMASMDDRPSYELVISGEDDDDIRVERVR